MLAQNSWFQCKSRWGCMGPTSSLSSGACNRDLVISCLLSNAWAESIRSPSRGLVIIYTGHGMQMVRLRLQHIPRPPQVQA